MTTHRPPAAHRHRLHRFVVHFELLSRCRQLYDKYRSRWGSSVALLLTATLLQTLAGFAPLFALLSWPLLVYGCLNALASGPFPAAQAPSCLAKAMLDIGQRTADVVGVILFTAVGFVGLRAGFALATAMPGLLHFYPGPSGALLAFSFTEAVVQLVVAACVSQMVGTGLGPLKALSAALHDMVFSPVSWLVLVVIEAVVLSPLALKMGLMLKLPRIATLIGHAPFSFLVLIWVSASLRTHQTR